MLQKCFELTDQLYDPINHLTQSELIEKFNLAFYKAQNLSKIDILTTFNETEEGSLPDVTEMNGGDYTNDDYLIDYLISNSPLSTPNSEVDPSFDFDDFVVDFDQSISRSEDQTKLFKDNNEINYIIKDFDSKQNCNISTANASNEGPLEHFGISFVDIDITDALINNSLDTEHLTTEIEHFDESVDSQLQDHVCNGDVYSPVGINKKNIDFNNFLRSFPAEELGANVLYNNISPKNEFGHLVGIKCINNNITSSITEETTHSFYGFEKTKDNQKILPQNEALLNDDPLLSFSNIMYTPKKKECYSKITESDNDDNQTEVVTIFQCRWENCYQMHDSQDNLVKHIEKYHVELKRGEEFTCFWENCPRKTKPFNARYKLLIHMRVHSGEKPNKCPFKGCSKAFSRLENLKIHQRSHTGERPYLCQFPTCTKSFSNSSDRAKHQRTHFDTKPYACQVAGCNKKYTDPSSLRKHVKNHTTEEQKQLKKKSNDNLNLPVSPTSMKKYLDIHKHVHSREHNGNLEHSYSSSYLSSNVKQDLKNKLFERNRQQKVF